MNDRASFIIGRALPIGVFGFLVAIYAIRSKAIARDHNPVAIAAALVGSFVLYGLFLIPGQGRSSDIWVLAGSDMCLACGISWALYSLSYLGRRFSIVPEARGLVTGGPYMLTRHPIYLGEILAGFGLVLPTVVSLHAVVFAVFLAAQLARTYFEERVLRSTYPQYEAYARRTRRLIPFVL